MRGPRGEGVSFLGVVAVLVVDLGETLLPVGDAELGNVRRDAEARQAGPESSSAIVQRPARNRLAAVELGDAGIKLPLGPTVVNRRAADHVVLAARELAP